MVPVRGHPGPRISRPVEHGAGDQELFDERIQFGGAVGQYAVIGNRRAEPAEGQQDEGKNQDWPGR